MKLTSSSAAPSWCIASSITSSILGHTECIESGDAVAFDTFWFGHLFGFLSQFIKVRVVTRSTRAVRDHCRLPTSRREKLRYLVDIPTVLDTGPYTEVGRQFGGEQSCAPYSLFVRSVYICILLLYPSSNHWAP